MWHSAPTWAGLPLDRNVHSVLEAQRHTFENLGCIVEEACPDLSGADRIFLDIRLWSSFNVLGPLLETHRQQMKPEAIWQIEAGGRVTATDVAQAMIRHGELL